MLRFKERLFSLSGNSQEQHEPTSTRLVEDRESKAAGEWRLHSPVAFSIDFPLDIEQAFCYNQSTNKCSGNS